MSFDSSNFTGSVLYDSYAKFNQITFITGKSVQQNPYALLQSAIQSPDRGFNEFAINGLGTSEANSYYKNIMPYFFLRYSCFDELSEIKNINENFEKIKLPLKYFTTGELFGLSTILESIQNDTNIFDVKSWDFYSNFTDDGKISNTDDFRLNAQGVFYNTLYKYFRDGYYQLGLSVSGSNNYTSKGKIVTDSNNKDTYVKGKGEAPNYLDISVNSKQKIKNKVYIKAKAVRTSYNSTVQPPKQIIIKRNNEELLSCLALEELNSKAFSNEKEYYSFASTSLSNVSLDATILSLIRPMVLYFNVIHYILRSAVVNHMYFLFNAQENNIFESNSLKEDIPQAGKNLQNIISSKSLGFRELVSRFALYLKELIINLLNLVDPTQVGATCDKVLDYFQDNNPNFNNLYSREELKNILITLNEMCFQTFKKNNPKEVINSADGKRKNNVSITKVLTPLETQHSNDLILQKVYVYRSPDKPVSYDDILQESKLYKVIDLPRNKDNITLSEIAILEDNIDTNKKYYYCFLSEREYDIYDEILNLKDEKLNKKTIPLDKSEVVQHFSSPTKVLELEMISTENSTYLDYNFFIPEEKEVVKTKVNFLNKIKVSPSDIQKYSYDKNLGLTGGFVRKPGLLDFWYNTEKLIPSNDYKTGQTLKLRLSSPKTKRKLDINVRHFVLDFYNLGSTEKKSTYSDIDLFSGGKKYYEVFSAQKPEIKFVYKYLGKELDLSQGSIKDVIFGTKDPQLIGNNISYNLNQVKGALIFKDPNNPKIDGYFQKWEGTISAKSNTFNDEIVNSSTVNESEYIELGLSFPFKSAEEYNSFIFQQKMTDKFGFNPQSGIEFIVNMKTVEYKLSSFSANQIPKGTDTSFSLDIKNYPIESEKQIKWEIVGVDGYNPSNDFLTTSGFLTINNQQSNYVINISTIKNTNSLNISGGTYKILLYNNSNLSSASSQVFLESEQFSVLSIPGISTNDTKKRSRKRKRRKSCPFPTRGKKLKPSTNIEGITYVRQRR